MDWISITFEEILIICISALAVYFLLMVFVKINGLRSFSKMSAHDFAVTVAIGSIVAGTVINKNPSILQGALAIAVLLFLQSGYSIWRLKRNRKYLENEPLLLMEGSKILEENLNKAKITKADVMAKLREANVLDFEEIKFMVFEATGDISVLHGDKLVNEKLLEDVKR